MSTPGSSVEYFYVNTQITDGLAGEEGPSKTAFSIEMIKKAVSNQLYEKDLTITADNAPGSVYGQVTKSFTPHGATLILSLVLRYLALLSICW